MSLNRCNNGHMFSERRYGKICPYCNIAINRIDIKEDPQGMNGDVTYLGDLEVLKPIVGWLVCLEGPSKGKDYRIVAQKNYIGRSADMDIRTLGDNEINQRSHGIIVYDPESNDTMLLPGDSQGLVYFWSDNDGWKVVYESKKLNAGDRIKIGKSIFMFVPFCGNNNKGFTYSWSDK